MKSAVPGCTGRDDEHLRAHSSAICDTRDMSGDAAARTIERLVGVYDADATLRGEVAYWIGARLGRRHCSLCDITHGVFRERTEWVACRAGLPIPFDTYHRDDQPDDVRAVVGDRLPAVVAVTGSGVVPLLDRDGLEACDGSVERLVESLERAALEAGLDWHQR